MSVFSSRSPEAANQQRSTPDAVGRGLLGHASDGQPTLFVLAGASLGTTPVGTEGTPQWYDLRRLVNLDAVGDPVGARLPVEASFDGGPVIQALWPEPFCDQVVERLKELLDSGQMLPTSDGGSGGAAAVPPVSQRSAETGPIDTTAQSQQPAAAAPPAPVAQAAPPAPQQAAPQQAPAPQPAPPSEAPVASPQQPAPQYPAPQQPAPHQPAPQYPAPQYPAPQPGDPQPVPQAATAEAGLWAATDDRPLPGDGASLPGAAQASGELTLENVVYHGGYPGQTKRRKKCVAVMNAAGLTVNGPHGPDFHIGWDVVRTVEAQNADEAKFRIGVKARRKSTVVVFDCDQGVTIVLEANDVPTMPLKTALNEMLAGGPVKVA